MLASNPPSLDAAAERDPDDLVQAGLYASAADAFEHGLVVLALGSPFWLLTAEDGCRLMVDPAVLARTREQLACYDRESRSWPPPPLTHEATGRKAELATPLLWALIVLASFRAQSEWPGWTGVGALDAQAVFARGELWRPFTALFLHADAGHLTSNLLSGIFVFSAVVSTVGRRRGWGLIAAAAVLGNVAVAALNVAGDYRSIGASTAIFAALGLLTGQAVRAVWRSRRAWRWRAVFVPVAAGLTVLGLYGAGGVHIDVLAHATGFAAGGLLGAVLGAPEPASPVRRAG